MSDNIDRKRLEDMIAAREKSLYEKQYCCHLMPEPTLDGMLAVTKLVGVKSMDDALMAKYKTLEFELQVLSKFEDEKKAQELVTAIFGKDVNHGDFLGADLDEAIDDFFFRYFLRSGMYRRFLNYHHLLQGLCQKPTSLTENPNTLNEFGHPETRYGPPSQNFKSLKSLLHQLRGILTMKS